MSNIFPAEIMEFTAEYHFNKHNPKTIRIYQIILGMGLLTAVLTFVIKVDISVKSLGILRTMSDNNQLKSIVSGKVEEVLVKENQVVKAGQTLLRIKADILDQQANLLQSQEEELQNRMDDLRKLLVLGDKNIGVSKPILKSSLYNQQFMFFRQRVAQVKNRLAIVQKNYERYTFLFKKKVISAAEYDEANFAYQQAKNELQLLYEEQGAQWQADLTALKMEIEQLGSKLKQSDREKDFYVIKAPIDGVVQNLKGLHAGSAISNNELLGEISANSDLLAETYVLPKDIGFLKMGTPARMQIDAFDYNQWGTLEGDVQSISGDIYTDKQRPYFKVLVRLKANKLTLKNGYIGHLKKGMTLQARFFVVRRTLFQLLYDKVDDWLNPNVMQTENS